MDRSYGPPWPGSIFCMGPSPEGLEPGPLGPLEMGVGFLVGHSPGGPLPHTGCFGEPSPNRALRHAISSHADGPFYSLGYGPQLQILLWSRCSPHMGTHTPLSVARDVMQNDAWGTHRIYLFLPSRTPAPGNAIHSLLSMDQPAAWAAELVQLHQAVWADALYLHQPAVWAGGG